MYHLDAIVRLNNAAARMPRSETETTRHCSFNETSQGIILHSAKHRNTLFLTKGPESKNFLRRIWSTNSVNRRDEIIESYFS